LIGLPIVATIAAVLLFGVGSLGVDVGVMAVLAILVPVVAAIAMRGDRMYSESGQLLVPAGAFEIAAVTLSLSFLALVAGVLVSAHSIDSQLKRLDALLPLGAVLPLAAPYAWSWVTGSRHGRTATTGFAGLYAVGAVVLAVARAQSGDTVLAALEVALAFIFGVLGWHAPTRSDERKASGLEGPSLLRLLGTLAATGSVVMIGKMVEIALRHI
jgi:hypothetical protein